MVGEENSKTFLLHPELLASELDRLAKDVNGGFNEQSGRGILLHEEGSGLFRYFVEYLYRSEWLADKQVRRDSGYVNLARLYALGEKLQAHHFQLATLRKFTSSWSSQISLSDQGVYDLLEVPCAELPERRNEDPLRTQIFWYATSKLTRLQNYDYFLRLLGMHEDLGKYLCIRAGNSSALQPTRPAEPFPERFRPESIYHI